MRISKEYLNELFEYRDGMIFWKIKTGQAQQKIGDRAGSQKKDGYRNVCINRKLYKEHRVIWFMHYGETDSWIDHKDRNPANNRIENLRLSTPGQNTHNQKMHRRNKSGFKGVSFNKAMSKWHARIYLDRKLNHLGFFDTVQEAHEAYKKAAIELHGEFANY